MSKLVKFTPREQTTGNVALNWFDRREIKRQKQRTEKKKQLHNAKIEERVLDSEQRQNDLEQRQKEQEQEINNVKKEVSFLKSIIEKADLTATKDYFTTVAENQAEQTEQNKKTGYDLQQMSRVFSYITSATSIAGIITNSLQALQKEILARNGIGIIYNVFVMVVLIVAFVYLSKGYNRTVEATPTYETEFHDQDDRQKKQTNLTSKAFIVGNIALSVTTNYWFWGLVSNCPIIIRIILSVMFDLGVFATSNLGHNFIKLRYNKLTRSKYENKLKEITENEQKNSEKIEENETSQNKVNNNFATISKNKNLNENSTDNSTENSKESTTKNSSKKRYGRAGRKNTSKSKKNKLINAIENLENNTIITPKKTGFENDVTTYRRLIKELVEELEIIEEYTDKNGNTRYRKIGGVE